MFSESRKGKGQGEALAQQNVIAQSTKITGDIVSEGAFRIDGHIEGNIKTPGKIVVGQNGSINGTLEGDNADFEGKFSGKLFLSGTLTLKSTAYIEGDVVVGKLSVEPGATFNATCSMKGAVKELKGGKQSEKSA